jgi:uncharacterized protein
MPKGDQKERPVLVIPVRGLEEREYRFEFEPLAEEFGVGDCYEGKLQVYGMISRVGSQFHVHGEVAGKRIGECDRCLCGTIDRATATFESVFSTGDLDLDDDGIIPLGGEGNDIVLDAEVRQVIRLQIPMKNLCRDDCKGLCASCGADLNVGECTCAPANADPRWSKLLGLLGDEPDSN